MDERTWLEERFGNQRPRLQAVAYRILGSTHDAEDAVQDAWLRVSRSDTDEVTNLDAWLTTVVARVSLNLLRSRSTRREQPLEEAPPGASTGGPAPAGPGTDPEEQAVLADSVGLALLVVLDTLAPAERLAFVLHDMFDLPFDEIAPIVDRSPAAARQLASRARRRVRGQDRPTGGDLATQRRVVDAYLAATRDGDFAGLLALLDPDVVLRADAAALPTGQPVVLTGAGAVAEGAMASSARARSAEPALVDGTVGLVMAPRGQLFLALRFGFAGDRITEIDVVADPDRLRRLELAVV
ncbi:sigma-70 family RNA polymerase sigma factor [Ornithinicoccus halotolerans]|uniref:sigma-70 family RNA polymerase sigma factor n=1 Tax=Ornithinicoccus halotolerans TaxID=1748220 RepID=UPI001295BC84|nr:sigma-70 family RNA polymerase sigma factor [Ornithinicoccus halotolerans]